MDNPDLRAKHVKRLSDLEALQDYDTAVRGARRCETVFFFANVYDILESSFSAVSKPGFFGDLQNHLVEI